MNEINFALIRKWIEQGAPDLDTVSAMLGIYSLNLIQIVQGNLLADADTKRRLAKALDCGVEELWPEDEKQQSGSTS